MPRLSEEQVKQGLLHDDRSVRLAALHYFTRGPSRDTSVMPVVIEAIERYGAVEAFEWPHLIGDLALTEETARWAVEKLRTSPRATEKHENFADALYQALANADPRLTLPHAAELTVTPKYRQDYVERLVRRHKYLSWDADALWRELEAVCEQGKDATYVGDMRWNDGRDLVDALARQGGDLTERVLDLLRKEITEYEGNPHAWMEAFAVRLAGELRLSAALPLLIEKLKQDDELLNEEGQRALILIGTDDVVRAVRDEYPAADYSFRLYTSSVLGGIHTDDAVRACVELLPGESDEGLRVWLAAACMDHLSTEGNEAVYPLVRDDPDNRELREPFVPACTLLGQEFPELEEWREMNRRDEQKRQKQTALFDATFGAGTSPRPARGPEAPSMLSPPTPSKSQKIVGRNDACPCGSGKKFKKCCINKSPLF